MTIHRLDQLVALFLTFFGGYLVWAGLQYGFMQGTTPGAGFFPVLMGGALVVLSLINLARSLIGRENLKEEMTRGEVMKAAAIIAALLVFVLITQPLGITLATMLLMLAIGLIIKPSLERSFLLRLGLTAMLFPIACRLVFGNLLHVPLPKGPFGL